MTTTDHPSCVLHIGIYMGRRLLQERILECWDSVTIGTSDTNTFALPTSPLLPSQHALFSSSHGTWVLHGTDGMGGRIRTGDRVVSLQRLAHAHADGIPLELHDRGKVVLGDVAILFQLVDRAPVGALAPPQRMDFRPRMLEDDDPVFLGFLGLWSALASVLVVWVWQAEPAPYEITDLPERIARLQRPTTVVLPDVTPDPDPQSVPTPVPAVPDPVGPVAETAPAALPRDVAEVRADVLKQSTLLAALLGTTGESTARAAALWSPDERGLADLDAALAAAGGVATDASQAGPRMGHAGTDRAADIGDLVGSGGGQARSIEGPAVAIEQVRSLPGEFHVDLGDRGAVEKAIARYAGHLGHCYEKRLKVHPTLEGRVEMSWVVEDGAVVGMPWIVANTTGDDELAQCVQQRIRRWTFPGFDGEAHSPFLFRPM